MKIFSLANRPEKMSTYQKSGTIKLAYINEPFYVATQEGTLLISPATVKEWDEDLGYGLAYPSDGSEPYAIAPSFIRKNYTLSECGQYTPIGRVDGQAEVWEELCETCGQPEAYHHLTTGERQ